MRRLGTAAILAVAGLAAGVAMSAIPAPAHAAPVGATIDDLVYTADDADVGAGATVVDYVGSATTLTIPATVDIAGTTYAVTAIGYRAFVNDGFTAVDLPASLTSIGDSAFLYNHLTSVDLPASLTSIGERAFADNELTSIVIPASLTSIGDWAFLYNHLASVDLPASLTSIGEGVFTDNELTSIDLPASLTSIGDSAFLYNHLASVDLPASLTTIGNAAFADNELTSIVIPASVTAIGEYAFLYNSALSRVVFEGDAPTIAPATASGSFAGAAGKTLYFRPGATGFTRPAWQGYDTNVLFTVTFDSGAGTPVATADVGDGELLAAPASPTRDDYAFTGWFTEPTGAAEYDFATPITGDLTLYAGWRSATLPPTGDALGPGPVVAGALLALAGLLLLVSRSRAAATR